MLYKYLFNYTKNDYYNLIKREFKLMGFGALISVTFLAILYCAYIYGFKIALFFIPIVLFSSVIFLRYVFIYIYEMLRVNINYIECHYATITSKYDSKKDRYFYHVSYLNKEFEYKEQIFRFTTTKKRENNIIFNGKNIVLYYTKLTNILIGFMYNGKAVKFYNVDNGESQKVYESLIQK